MLYGVFLYIDPGTGGMLFTIIFAALGTLYYLAQALSVKIRFLLSGGKAASISEEKIPIAIFCVLPSHIYSTHKTIYAFPKIIKIITIGEATRSTCTPNAYIKYYLGQPTAPSTCIFIDLGHQKKYPVAYQ